MVGEKHMEKANIDSQTMQILKLFQKAEITGYTVYKKLAEKGSGKNGEILHRIAREEFQHSQTWKRYTGCEIRPNRFLVFWYLLMARVFGLTFAIKMMEQGEVRAEKGYARIGSLIPETSSIIKEENEHEMLLIGMIDEQKIKYISSMVLGINDALVELTGTLAGLTLALQNTRLIGLAGLITGIAASLSMAASEYLSQKSEKESKDPLKAAFYTGITYIVVVILLVLPYFLLPSYYFALFLTLTIAILIVLLFAHFVSVVKEIPFKKFFSEMVMISLGVAAIAFFIGWIARSILHLE